jgi:hypothetical protein
MQLVNKKGQPPQATQTFVKIKLNYMAKKEGLHKNAGVIR